MARCVLRSLARLAVPWRPIGSRLGSGPLPHTRVASEGWRIHTTTSAAPREGSRRHVWDTNATGSSETVAALVSMQQRCHPRQEPRPDVRRIVVVRLDIRHAFEEARPSGGFGLPFRRALSFRRVSSLTGRPSDACRSFSRVSSECFTLTLRAEASS